jgi:hypothetical protein
MSALVTGRPTNGVDLSSVASAVTSREHALEWAYRHSTETADYTRRSVHRLCVCGGWIEAESSATADVVAAIGEHNASHRHGVWRELTE